MPTNTFVIHANHVWVVIREKVQSFERTCTIVNEGRHQTMRFTCEQMHINWFSESA